MIPWRSLVGLLLLVGLTRAVDRVVTTPSLPIEVRHNPYVGNGQIATTVWTDSIFVDNVYEGYAGSSHRARVQAMYSSELLVISGCSDSVSATYKLDANEGIVSESLVCSELSVTQRVYAHQTLPALLVTEIELDYSGSSPDNVLVERIDLSGVQSDEFTWTQPSCDANSKCYMMGITKHPETDDSEPQTVHIYYSDSMPGEFTMPNGQQFVRNVYYMTIAQDQALAENDYDSAVSIDITFLRQIHIDEWETKWEKGDITLEGENLDPELEKTLFTSLYYIYSSLPAYETSLPSFGGLSPGGLANGIEGQDYQGHVFWDMDNWMGLPITMLRPDLGKLLLNYRIDRISEAQDRAQVGGYNGARYPWESAHTGFEVTPALVCIPCRENEQHITGDIAFAARNYLSLHGHDLSWLTSPQGGQAEVTGWEFMLEMAKFWESRPTFSDAKQAWEINGVMPPDENRESVNNSVYTNLVAEYSVTTARWAACLANIEADPDGANATAAQLVPDAWLDKLAQLYFPYNSEYRYHEEYEGFQADLEANPDIQLKQADVVLMGFPLLWQMPDDVRRNDLLFYENITTRNGPALTWGIFTIGYLDLGDYDKANEAFDQTYKTYIREPFKVWTEKQSGTGAVNFITGAGGFIQTLLAGFGGIRIFHDHLKFVNRPLPLTVDTMTFKNFDYHGSSMDVKYQPGQITITITASETTASSLWVEFEDGQQQQLVDTMVIPRQDFSLRPESTLAAQCYFPPDRFDGAIYN